MAKVAAALPIPAIEINRESQSTLQAQLYDSIREAILSGTLRPGARLPSTREAAIDLDVSRNTVMIVYEMLAAEGYLESRVGSGTRVSAVLPDDLTRDAKTLDSRMVESPRKSSRRSRVWRTATTDPSLGHPGPFSPGVPPLDLFPIRIWNQILARHWKSTDTGIFSYDDARGYLPLREAIADHISLSRGTRCAAEQVLVVGGAQQAIDLAARVVLDPGDEALIEEPCYRGAFDALRAAGARITPVPVDEEGLEIESVMEVDARLCYVTPSHQYPLGSTMGLTRRLKLLEWAQSRGGWIIEDDYDSEYRFTSRPLSSLQGLDDGGSVIYVGTFNKVLVPATRIGFVVCPEDLVDSFEGARIIAGRATSQVFQAALADFMNEGHLARHIRRIRGLMKDRQEVLLSEIDRLIGGTLDVSASDAGMHLVGWLPESFDDRKVSEAAAAEGIDAPPLSAYYTNEAPRPGLVLGYGGVPTNEIREAVERLARAIENVTAS